MDTLRVPVNLFVIRNALRGYGERLNHKDPEYEGLGVKSLIFTISRGHFKQGHYNNEPTVASLKLRPSTSTVAFGSR